MSADAIQTRTDFNAVSLCLGSGNPSCRRVSGRQGGDCVGRRYRSWSRTVVHGVNAHRLVLRAVPATGKNSTTALIVPVAAVGVFPVRCIRPGRFFHGLKLLPLRFLRHQRSRNLHRALVSRCDYGRWCGPVYRCLHNGRSSARRNRVGERKPRPAPEPAVAGIAVSRPGYHPAREGLQRQWTRRVPSVPSARPRPPPRPSTEAKCSCSSEKYSSAATHSDSSAVWRRLRPRLGARFGMIMNSPAVGAVSLGTAMSGVNQGRPCTGLGGGRKHQESGSVPD